MRSVKCLQPWAEYVLIVQKALIEAHADSDCKSPVVEADIILQKAAKAHIVERSWGMEELCNLQFTRILGLGEAGKVEELPLA